MTTHPQPESLPANSDENINNDNPNSVDPLLATFVKPPITLAGQHRRAVSAIGIDPSGGRMFTAGYDYFLKHWDKYVPFREDEEPFGSYPLRTVAFSSRGDKALIVPRSPQPAIMSREGKVLYEFPRGDQYLLDKRKTCGHSGSMCGGQWHPSIQNCFVTGAADGTIRIWDVPSKASASVILTGPRNQVTCVAWHQEGSGIFSATSGGAIQLWSNNKKVASLSLGDSLAVATSILHLKDKQNVAIRSTDGFLRLWDVRKLVSNAPLATCSLLPTAFDETDVIYSPINSLLLTGTSNAREGSGSIHAFDAQTLDLVNKYDFSYGIVRLAWDNNDDLLVGLSNGSISLFSKKDVILPPSSSSVTETKSFTDLSFIDLDINAGVYLPDIDPVYDEDYIDLGPRPTKKRPDPVATKRPEMPPISGPGKGGKIGTSAAQQVLKHLIPDRSRDEDPREALLKYAKIAEEDPKFVTPAYKVTQPKTIFSQKKG